MKKDGGKNIVHERRLFFKKATKGVLPIIGAIIVGSTPNVVNAQKGCSDRTGC